LIEKGGLLDGLEPTTPITAPPAPGRANLGFVTPSFREGSLILENNLGVMFRLIWEDGKNKKDELSTVPLGTPGVHLREVLEDAFHEEIL